MRASARRSIVLVGLMGAGKTSVGKRLAALLGVPFTDSDSRIVEAAGMSIPEIFASLGEAAFRDGERRVIARLLAERPGVLATGGGAFVEPRTREEIAARGDLGLAARRPRDAVGAGARPAGAAAAADRRPEGRRSPTSTASARRSMRWPTSSVDSRRGISHEAMARSIVAAVRARDDGRPDRRRRWRPRP